MKRSLFPTLALAAALTACSKTSNLTVTVQDTSSIALSGANVTASPQGKAGVTDVIGEAKFSDLDREPTVVIAEKPGYMTKAVAVDLPGGKTSVTVQLSSITVAKTTVKVYQGNPTTNPYTVTAPEASLSGKVVVQTYILWEGTNWVELPVHENISSVQYLHTAQVSEGSVKFVTYYNNNNVWTVSALYNALRGSDYKIVVTIPPAGAPREDTAWYGSTER